ncbi:cytochrome P450 [Aspergillus sclerotioniger CBS 115572]|uniref:Cytochrome P450 n=1 Tax=Aspergillus sclerotioniger CBS 115572 TaxID=1450535 RepID=A0A317XAD6_9EURO|nr:cytochrome P450 [Aspergillus sclerotioniger CBS 115572]PWY95191.1 cytochrome P450 [Aspergillus sclerotioniger CBS 115572]
MPSVWFALVAAPAVAVLVWIWPHLKRASPPPGIPILSGTETTDYRHLIEEQYTKHPNQIYLLQSPFRRVYVVPPRLVNEYAWKSEDKVSSAVDLCERFLGQYTLIGSMTPDRPGDRTHTAVTYAKGLLTRSINHALPGVYTDVDTLLDREIGKDKSRTVHIQAVVLNVFLHVYERVFVGIDLAQDKTWMRTCVEYPGAAFRAALALAKYHWSVRPIAALFIPEMKLLRVLIRILDRFLRPLHQQRQELLKQVDAKKPVDIIQSFMDHAGKEATNTTLLVESMVMLNIAGIQSTGRVLFQALLDLAAHPEYIQPLRDEVAAAIDKEGGDPNLLATGLARLQKMDSFFKESQRFHHANLLSVYRKLMQPLTLSNGVTLPANSYIAVPGSVYSRLSDDGTDRPFDGFQWARKKGGGASDSRLNYAFSGPDSLEFGAGSHACPGRHFAVNVLKATLSRILLRYDLSLPPGTERPRDQFNHLFDLVPNPAAALVCTPRGIDQ